MILPVPWFHHGQGHLVRRKQVAPTGRKRGDLNYDSAQHTFFHFTSSRLPLVCGSQTSTTIFKQYMERINTILPRFTQTQRGRRQPAMAESWSILTATAPHR